METAPKTSHFSIEKLMVDITSVMPEGEKNWGIAVVIGGDNLPVLVGIGLTDLLNMGGQWPPWPPCFGHHWFVNKTPCLDMFMNRTYFYLLFNVS